MNKDAQETFALLVSAGVRPDEALAKMCAAQELRTAQTVRVSALRVMTLAPVTWTGSYSSAQWRVNQ